MSTAAELSRLREVHSSSPGLSSPPSPRSPTNNGAPTTSIVQTNAILHSQNSRVDANVGSDDTVRPSLAKNIITLVPKKVSKPRKKKEVDVKTEGKSSTATATDVKVPSKPRKPRAAPGTGIKRKSKTSEEKESKLAATQAAQRQTKITESLATPALLPDVGVLASHPLYQNGKDEAIPTSHDKSHNSIHMVPRATSGQNYDPIRSSTIEPRAMPYDPIATRERISTPPRPSSYPNASPGSIASLIEPPASTKLSSIPQPSKRGGEILAPSPPGTKKPRLSPPESIPAQQSFKSIPRELLPANLYAATSTDVDTDQPCQTIEKYTTMAKKSSGTTPGASSSAHSPKPTRKKETSVAIPTGNGLLSGTIFGGAYDNTGPEKTAPTVILHVPLDGENKYVNFARLAEEQYGFNALHPRLAAQQERLARVAAAGAAIENASKGGNSGSGISADDMSVDLSEGDGDLSNVEMSGMRMDLGIPRSGGEGSEGPLPKKAAPKKRMMKEDMYDKEDPFVDDTEMAWEEQAAASKDGFFVYSGLLVPEGEDANVERHVFRSHYIRIEK